MSFEATRLTTSDLSSTASPNSTNRRHLKWYSSIDRIFHPTHHIIDEQSKERFYLDFYLLKPDKDDLRNKLEGINVQALLGTFKQNLNDLIGYGIKCLKNATTSETTALTLTSSSRHPTQSTSQNPGVLGGNDHSHDNEVDQIRLLNALEILSVTFKTMINKDGFENLNVDLIALTAGSIENSDSVFADFVESIDKILCDQTHIISTRHRTLQLALSLVSGVNQGSINAYFLRRDLFNTIASLIASPDTVSLIFDSVLLLDLLANFRRFESRNPYLGRMEDYVDEKAMERIISLTILALEDLRVAYHKITNPETNPSLIKQVTHSVLGALSSPLSKRTSSPIGSTNPAFGSHPGLPTCILLPIYDLLCSNTTFFNVLVSSKPFWESFLSFSSYLLSHASSNARSELYGRLVMVILIHLAEEAQKVICGEIEEPIKVTLEVSSHRQPASAANLDLGRIPIMAMLDCGVIYLRNNNFEQQRHLKIESYAVCLRLIHELLFCLKSNQIRLEGFEWGDLWRAVLSFANQVGSRIEELKDVPDIDRLAQQILDILSFAAIWSENLFKDNLTISVFYTEILKSEETIKQLIRVANLNSSGSSGNNLGVSTIESVKNLNTIISKSKEILEQSRNKNSSILRSPNWMRSLFAISSFSPTTTHPNSSSNSHQSYSSFVIGSTEDCINILQVRLNEIELMDSASLETHLRKYSENEKMKDLKKFIDLITQDVFQLMVI